MRASGRSSRSLPSNMICPAATRPATAPAHHRRREHRLPPPDFADNAESALSRHGDVHAVDRGNIATGSAEHVPEPEIEAASRARPKTPLAGRVGARVAAPSPSPPAGRRMLVGPIIPAERHRRDLLRRAVRPIEFGTCLYPAAAPHAALQRPPDSPSSAPAHPQPPPPVHVHVPHRTITRGIDQAADRIVRRAHHRMRNIDHDQDSARHPREPPNIIPPRGRAPPMSRLEQIGRIQRARVPACVRARYATSRSSSSMLLIGIVPDTHIDTGPLVSAEILQRDPRRANTVGQCATVVPVSASRFTSVSVCHRVDG